MTNGKPFDILAHNRRIAEQAEAATILRMQKEVRELRDVDRRFYRNGTILLFIFLFTTLAPLRFALDLAFENWVMQDLQYLRKFAFLPITVIFVAMAALGIIAIFHRRY